MYSYIRITFLNVLRNLYVSLFIIHMCEMGVNEKGAMLNIYMYICLVKY